MMILKNWRLCQEWRPLAGGPQVHAPAAPRAGGPVGGGAREGGPPGSGRFGDEEAEAEIRLKIAS